MADFSEANIHTTKLVLIKKAEKGLYAKPFAVTFLAEGSQAWEDAWLDEARRYLAAQEKRNFEQRALTVQ